MGYAFTVMTQKEAEEIAHNWYYEGKYSFYDIEEDAEDLAEFLHDESRGDDIYVVKENSTLIGFFSFCKINNRTVDIGLGMRPDITGNGLGLKFVKAGLDFSKEKYGCNYITLSVATFNERAIKVYKRAGFEAVGTFIQKTNGSCFEFLKMNYICKND
ncbi:GNAT family N-acetyltransferase [Bacillus cereus]|jgi:ribosomal-protein-alanine N-acetyltransferase|uniref:GNAT family N-acetyltransferase n=1 Tax=Bacillus cereus TaxID=1396 RepID=A0A2B2LJS0_BACCE|nr:GNAT family protein [Bacillus cereus]MDR2995250.1 GNAT family N-acetyltransferase [Bacillus cereus]PFQ43208.1 GNAT family N-acetyltransferase [Bacillus cereus]PGU09084.1 GNAT family N-acetyltransferase [Bacillus cereus]